MRENCLVCLFAAVFLAGCNGGSGSGDGATSPLPLVNPTEEPQGLPRSDVRGLDQLRPYRADGAYAGVLKSCALIDSVNQACSLEVLPFLAQATPNFNREDILDRLLVTHDWMGERFEQLLTQAPEHMITLFGSLTTITIGSTVRPSNYWIGTGGIRIDPDYLWLRVEEKANVSIEQDYRSGYGRDLQFWSFGSLRRRGEAATRFYSLTDDTERTLRDIRLPVFRLLYHELAHAADFLPSSSFATLDASLRPAAALSANDHYWLSPQLHQDLPLYSETLRQLAQVSFRGRSATEAETLYTPGDVGSLMGGDGAAKYYGYSTIREDFATLFATAMIKYDFDVDYYTAFVQKPLDETNYRCDELLVGWGVRNRIADAQVALRARWVVRSIYGASPWIDQFFDTSLGQSSMMTPGQDWCSNRDNVTSAKRRSRSFQAGSSIESHALQQLEAERRDYRH